MAEDPDASGAKDKPERRSRGFRLAGALIAQQTRTAAARRGYLEARLKALWVDIAGAEIASVTRPLKLASTRGPAGGLLTLGVHGANGPQIQMLLPLIRERINAALGAGAVGRIQITQSGLAEQAAPFAPRAHAPPPPADIAQVAEALSSIGDADLRAALETLARNVISRAANADTKGS